MSMQLGSKAGEEAKLEPGDSTSTAAISRRRIVYRPFNINSQTSTTTVTATIRDTLIAVRDAVAASIMANSSSTLPKTVVAASSSTLPKISTSTADGTDDTATVNTHASTSNVSQQHTTCLTNLETNVATPAIGTINKVPRRWEQWNSSEINAFFEGIKLVSNFYEKISHAFIYSEFQLFDYWVFQYKAHFRSTYRSVTSGMVAITNYPV